MAEKNTGVGIQPEMLPTIFTKTCQMATRHKIEIDIRHRKT